MEVEATGSPMSAKVCVRCNGERKAIKVMRYTSPYDGARLRGPCIVRCPRCRGTGREPKRKERSR